MPPIQPLDAAAATGKGALGGKIGEQFAITASLEIVHTKGRVSDAALSTVRLAGLADGEIVEVAGHVALNIFTNYLNNLAGTDADFPVVVIEKAA